jgi:HD domain-containing protein
MDRIGLVADLERDTARRAASALATEALRIRDSRTAEHCDDVLTLCDAVGRRLGLDEMLLRQLASGAQLHDIGKVGIPLSILNKPSALTEAEWTTIREHTVIGERILRSVPAMSDVATIVRHSHEHWDGSGYPDGLSGEAIPLPSRVILCADAFHAMRCDRPYRRGRAAHAALAEIEACAGTQFDPVVADTLVAVAADARNGGVLQADPLRKKRLIALLTALAIGTGTALATIPAVRDAIKSVFAASTPATSDAASASPDLPGFRLESLHSVMRPPVAAPSRPEHATPTTAGHAKASDSVKASRPVTHQTQTQTQPQPAPEVSSQGRALGRDVPVPRAPVQKPEGGRTDPPALGLEAGPNGAGQPPSRNARDRSATR